MTKIYKDANNKYVAATVIYSSGFSDNPKAYHDADLEHPMTSEELREACINRAIVINPDDDIDFYIPVEFEGANVSASAQVSIIVLDDGALTMVSIKAVDSEE